MMSDKQPYEWAEFLRVAEELRRRKQEEFRITHDRQSSSMYSQRDMCAHVRGYKSLIEKTRRTLPDEKMIKAIVEYLECPLAQHNALRRAIGLVELQSDPEGEEYLSHINSLRNTLCKLPFPAYIVDRNWYIYAVNQQLLTLLNLSERKLESIRAEHFNILHFIFNPALNLRHRLTGGKGGWNAIAERNVYIFKRYNYRTLNEPQVHKLLTSLREIPGDDFQKIWEGIRAVPDEQSPFYIADYVTEMQTGDDRIPIIKFQVLHIQYADVEFPRILAYTPFGRETEQFFGKLQLHHFPEDDIITTNWLRERYKNT